MGFLKDKTAYNQVTDDNKFNLFLVSVWNGTIFRTRKLNRNNLNVWRYTEIPISSAEMLALGDTPKELLTIAGANKYYKIGCCIFELTAGATPYTFTGKALILNNGENYSYLSKIAVTSGTNRVGEFTFPSTVFEDLATDLYVLNDTVAINGSVSLLTDAPVTLGDGTGLVKIWYQVKTLGTEL